MPTLPLVVLAHGKRFGVAETELGFSALVLQRARRTAQERLGDLVPGARFVIAERSGHYVQLQEPELVINAVWSVFAAVHDPDTWATLIPVT